MPCMHDLSHTLRVNSVNGGGGGGGRKREGGRERERGREGERERDVCGVLTCTPLLYTLA